MGVPQKKIRQGTLRGAFIFINEIRFRAEACRSWQIFVPLLRMLMTLTIYLILHKLGAKADPSYIQSTRKGTLNFGFFKHIDF